MFDSRIAAIARRGFDPSNVIVPNNVHNPNDNDDARQYVIRSKGGIFGANTVEDSTVILIDAECPNTAVPNRMKTVPSVS